MKLRAIHLLIILIGSLIFCSVCSGIVEGMTSSSSSTADVSKTYDNYDDYYNDKTGSSSNVDESSDATHSQYTGPAGDTVDVYSGNQGTAIVGPRGNVATTTDSSSASTYNSNTATVYTGPAGNSAAVVNSNGITRAQIPAGDEDMYILKSQIVPPVCPVCPTITTCPREEACPACPPCARCPEPSFECKKVPNYSAGQSQYLPRPVLSDFSQFGM